jgi:HSP20 family protein
VGKWDFFHVNERVSKFFDDPIMPSTTGTWTPIVDIYEASDRFIVKAELPEVSESNIKIVLEDNTLKISGERILRMEGRNYYQIERTYGRFFRSISLPCDIDSQNIKATLSDGILKIIIPKKDRFLKHLEIVED